MPWSDYTKIKAIGSGSFGRAFLVQADKKFLVMKEIDLSGRDSGIKSAAEVEVKVLSSLKHPYIVRYHESFMKDSVLCIVMDYCDGGDLWHYIEATRRRREPISEGQIVRWFTQMSLGLKYMHEKNPPILHRDIKTQNIFLARREGSDIKCAKIADFGIAKVLKGQNAMASTLVGTPYYLSPEICQKQPYACPSDVWAVGCVLYELCALRVPFDAKEMNELVQNIVRGPIPRVPHSYSRDLQDLVNEALTRDASKRPTAGALLQKKRLQEEIKAMLHENRRETGNAEVEDKMRRASSEVPQERMERPTPRPLMEHNSRGDAGRHRSNSGKPIGHRAPSPHKGAAQEVLRPSRAPSPTPRGHPSPTPRGHMPRPLR